MSGDIAAVTGALIAEGFERIALCGYSMGGNLVLKCAGEWGSAPPREVKAVAGVSPAMDLGISSDTLHDWSNRIYELKFLWGLNRRIRRKAALFPKHIDLTGIRWSRSLREFDEQVTARFSGFTGADDYYQRASSARVAGAITVPTLVIHSSDDPFIIMTPPTAALLRANPHVRLVETAYGGHCAFLADPDGSGPDGYDGRWAEREVIAFFQSHA
jgi:predicted alpha/beta-fold hydrolase